MSGEEEATAFGPRILGDATNVIVSTNPIALNCSPNVTLTATQGVATLSGIVAGLLGSGVVFGAFKVLKQAESSDTFRLEEMIGFALFERSGGRLKPTAEGMLFYAEAMRVLGEFDRLQTTTAQIREGQAGRLTIASHPWAAISLLPKLVSEFLSERPGVSVRLISP